MIDGKKFLFITPALYPLSMCCLNMFVKLTYASVPMILLARYTIALIILSPTFHLLKRRRCPIYLHFIRSVGFMIAQSLTYYGHKHCTFITANLISMSEPFLVMIFASLYKDDKIKPKQWLGLLVGYIGVCIMTIRFDAGAEHLVLGKGAVALIGANIMAALIIFVTSYLAKNEDLYVSLSYNMILMWFVSWFLVSDYTLLYNVVLDQWYILLMIALTGFSTQILSLLSLARLKPSVFSPFQYLRLIFSVIIAYFVFNELPVMTQFFGSIFIFKGLYMIFSVKSNKTKIEKQNA